jgi:cell division FtsZ-interacting protein ZapD
MTKTPTWKKTLMKRGMELMTDPRFSQVMQDERVMKALMTAMQMPGKVESFTAEQKERFAKALGLPTEQEVSDLRRTVRRLEEEIARLKR